MNKIALQRGQKGFTVIELIIVIIVLAILVIISFVAYNGIQNSARDKSIISDADGIVGEITRYSTKNNGIYGSALAWYSQGAGNSNINFKPSPGNIVDVVADNNNYCVRIYNPSSASYKKLSTAFQKGSTSSACSTLPPSALAQSDSDTLEGVATSWKQISSYGAVSCGVANNDKAYCWGNNASGQLGNNSNTDSSLPVAVDTSGVLSGKTIKTVSVGNVHVCALTTDGQVACWGNNSSGQLGNNSTTNSLVPVAVNTSGVLSGKTVKYIDSSTYKVCAIASDDKAYCWGENGYGQLGNNSLVKSTVPAAVDTSGVLSGKTIKSIKGGWWHTCAIASDNKAYCWGNNAFGQLGNNTTSNSSVPVAVDTSGVLSGKTIASIGGGNYTTCASVLNGNAYCWGSNSNGQIGNNSTTDSWVPVAVDTSGVLSGKTIKSVAVGASTGCVIASDNQAYCWGYNYYGELGNGSFVSSSTVPVAVSTSGVMSGKTINSLSMGTSNCLIASDNQAYCWGYNFKGQLGNNTTTNARTPVKVLFQ